MPDSLLPIQGPASYGERDLDALLSGEAGYPVMVHGPVADALAALRAAPAPDELSGEAAARAAFRLFLPPAAGVAGDAPVPVARPQVTASFHQVAAAGATRPDGQNPTVVLPRPAQGGPRHARRRHARQRRLVPWDGRWPVMAAASGAAAAVIIGVVALAGAFSGPGGQQGPSALRSSPAASDTSSHRPTSSVLGTATARPTPQASTDSPQSLCHQYFDFFTHPEQPANRPEEKTVIQELGQLAGGERQIYGYCARVLGAGARGYNPGFQGGDSSDRDRSGGAGNSRLDRAESAFPLVRSRPLSTGSVKPGRTAQ
jgi:hypothetical protein